MAHIRLSQISTGACAVIALATLIMPLSAVAQGVVPAPRMTATPKMNKKGASDDMSPMGHLARRVLKARSASPASAAGGPCANCNDDDSDFVDPDAPPSAFPGGGENSEISVGVDSTGQKIVVGFNDFRGFGVNSISGVTYSLDGGNTFTDGGQLPAGTAFVSGDPDVKWVPGGAGCQFIYSSILVNSANVQTMSLHRTTDCGQHWSGPYEVTPATNPGGSPGAADKEFLDVDPDTGRVLLSWTNFGTGVREIRTTYSDNVMTATPPTWSAGVVVSTTPLTATPGYLDSGSIPRFVGNGSNNAYVAFGRSNKLVGTPYSAFAVNNIGFARSTDNGATWSTPINLRSSDYYPPDYILGNDRTHSFPSMAVDNSNGPNKGNIYVVYADNNSLDGADIVVHRSTDAGLTFDSGKIVSANPGQDRPQWFPFVTVDSMTGRVNAFFYDQRVARSGDLTIASWAYSDNGGATWTLPMGMCAPPNVGSGPTNDCDRPFRAGFGNDTSQPNLGDYNGGAALLGKMYASFASTKNAIPMTDGEPSGSMTTPEVRFKKLSNPSIALQLDAISISDSGGDGFIDRGDLVKMTIGLKNYSIASLGGVTYTGVSATLSTTTAGITVTQPTQSWANIPVNSIVSNSPEFAFQVAASFVPGTPIEFVLMVTSAQGTVNLAFKRDTGTPLPTTVFSENFNGVAPGGLLPAGWTRSHAGGTNTVPWTTSNTFCGTSSNALFHINAEDGTPNPTRFERAFSPSIAIPADSANVTLDFDVCYDTEDAPDFTFLAYDGLLLRINDVTRSILAEAFADVFTTGALQHYPKHFPRNNSSAYFQDMSAWAGGAAAGPSGFQHVSMRLPGAAGRSINLRWEFTQDSGGTCNDARPSGSTRTCGVAVDNIVMNSIKYRTTLNASSQVSVTQNGFGRNRATGLWVATMTVTNTSATPISGPINVVLNNLSANATMTNNTGTTTTGPYITVTGATLAPGASASVSIQFANPTNGFINFTPVTYSGSF